MAGKYAADHGARPIGGSGRSIKGFRVVSDFETLLGQELKNTKTYIALPERFVFQAIQANETVEDAEADLKEQKDRVRRATQDDHDDRGGETPMFINRARGDRGERGETGAPGPPGAPANLQPVIEEMTRRLGEAESARARARDLELQNEMAHLRSEQARNAEITRMAAQAAANLTSIPSEIRILQPQAPAVPTVDHHARQALEHVSRQAADQHAATMAFVRGQAADMGGLAGVFREGMGAVRDGLGALGGAVRDAMNQPPPDPPIINITTGGNPPPPPAPGGARIATKKRAKPKAKARAIAATPAPPPPPGPDAAAIARAEAEVRKAVAAAAALAPSTPQPQEPEPEARHAPASAKPKPETADARKKREAASKKVESKTKPVKPKIQKKDPPAGLSLQKGPKDHAKKLTKHGPKPVLVPQGVEPEAPAPSIPHSRPPPALPRGTKRKKPEPDYVRPAESQLRKQPRTTRRVRSTNV